MSSSSGAQNHNSTSVGRDDGLPLSNTHGTLDVNTLLYHVENTMNCFDKIFHDIASCAAHYEFHRDPHKEIPRSQLSATQCAAIGQLSGYLTEVHEYVTDYKLTKKHEESSLKSFPLLQPKKDYDEHRKLCQRVTLLQEYLVNELTHSEQLESRLLEAESQLLKLTDEKNKLMKKISRYEGGGTMQVSASNTSTAHHNHAAGSKETSDTTTGNNLDEMSEDVDPLALLGKFIRKQFGDRKYFGLVCNYDKPYYGISYEDGDFEELGRNEVVHNLWEGIVPFIRHNTCFKHAKRMNSLHPSLREASSSTTTTSMTSISNQKVIDSVRNGVDAQVMSSETAAAGSNAISMTNTTTTTTTHGSEQSDDDNKASENSDVDGHGSNVSATTVESVNSPHAEFSRTSSPIAPDFYHPVSTSKSPLANKYNTTSSSPSAFHVTESKLDQARQQVTPPQIKKSPSSSLEKAMEILRSPERKKASSDGFHTLLPVAEAIQHPFVLMDPQQAKTTADSGGEESVEIQVSPVKLNTRRRLSRQSELPTSTDKRSRNSTSNGNNNTTTSRYVKSEHIRPFLHTDHEDVHSTKRPRILIDLSEL